MDLGQATPYRITLMEVAEVAYNPRVGLRSYQRHASTDHAYIYELYWWDDLFFISVSSKPAPSIQNSILGTVLQGYQPAVQKPNLGTVIEGVEGMPYNCLQRTICTNLLLIVVYKYIVASPIYTMYAALTYIHTYLTLFRYGS